MKGSRGLDHSSQDRQVLSAEVINSGINGDLEKIIKFNSPIDDGDGEPQVVDLTDDFDEEQEECDKMRQRSQDNDDVGQYFDNGDQFLSMEDQQRKLTQGNYNTQILVNAGSSNFLNLK